MGRFIIHNRQEFVQAIDYTHGKRYVFNIANNENSDVIEIQTLQKIVELDGENAVSENTDVGLQDVPNELYTHLDMEGYDVEKLSE